jgi:hypothetical protein
VTREPFVHFISRQDPLFDFSSSCRWRKLDGCL